MRGLDGAIVTPGVRDVERLQGFPPDWTLPAVLGRKTKEGARWKLVGNAVSVPVAEWLGRRLACPGSHNDSRDAPLGPSASWPAAAYSRDGQVFRADVSAFPVHAPYQHLAEFLKYPGKPLSVKAAAGFLSRAKKSTLDFHGLLGAVESHLARLQAASA
jgi:DNA (cytosine-5)-methyltransferase 1